MSQFFYGIRLFFVSVFCALLIAVTIACVVEVSGRLTAFRYIESKTGEIEERLTRSAQSQVVGIDGPESSASRSFDLKQLNVLRSISDDLTLLNFSGADQSDDTIIAIRYRLSSELEGVQSREDLRQAEELNSRLREGVRLLVVSGYAKEDFLRLVRDNIIWVGEGRDAVDRAISEISRLDLVDIKEHGASGEGLGYYTFMLTNSARSNFVKELLRAASEIQTNTVRSIEEQFEGVVGRSNLNEARAIFGIQVFEFHRYRPTDILIAVSVILAGGIGAISAATRRKSAFFMKSIVTGLLAGFIVLLIIKGGKSFFYVGAGSSQLIIVNPYALAFAGVLAGLFTERAFEILSQLVDELGDRITAKNNGAIPASVESTPRKTTRKPAKKAAPASRPKVVATPQEPLETTTLKTGGQNSP